MSRKCLKKPIIGLGMLVATTLLFSCAAEQNTTHTLPLSIKKPNLEYLQGVANNRVTGCQDGELKKQIVEMRAALDRTQSSGLVLGEKLKSEVFLLENFVSDIDSSSGDCKKASALASEYIKLNEIIDFNDPDDIRYRLAYHPLSLREVRRVQKDFGDLYLPETTKDWVRHEAKVTPWAGYWFPARKIKTLIGTSSPLSRLDRLLKMHGINSSIAKQERKTYNAVKRWAGWDGHCHAWAMASTMFAEPQKGIAYRTRRGRVSFSIADRKAILTKLAEATKHEVYGVRFGSGKPTMADSFAAFQDIRPEAFHTVLVEMLKKGLPVLIDDEPKEAVWTKPVYAVSFKTSKDPVLKNALLVETHYIAMRELGSFKSSNIVTSQNSGRRYKLKYRLFHDGIKNAAGEFKIIRGEWIEESRDRHPDVIIVPSDKAQSFNSDINKNKDLILKLIAQ